MRRSVLASYFLGVVLILVRGLSLVLGHVAGSESATFSLVLLSQCYFAGEAALIVALALVIWKCIPASRVIINLLVAS